MILMMNLKTHIQLLQFGVHHNIYPQYYGKRMLLMDPQDMLNTISINQMYLVLG